MQAVLANILSSASDLFQARKNILLCFTALACIGAFIAPGAHSAGRILAAQGMIGFGNAMMSITFAVPSEILPKKWRPSKST